MKLKLQKIKKNKNNMGTAAIISLILGITAAISGIAAGGASLYSQKKQNETNLQQYEDWKEYNSPAGQMERLEEAGLNKYLVSNVNNTLSAPFHAGEENAGNIFQNLSSVLQNGSMQALSHYEQNLNRDIRTRELENKIDLTQIKQQELQIRKDLAQQALEKGEYDIALKALALDSNSLQYLFDSESYDYRMNIVKSNSEYYQQRADNYQKFIDAQIAEIRANTNYKYGYLQYLNDVIEKEYSKLNWDMDKFYKQYNGLSAWQQEQVDMFLNRLNVSKDYFDLAHKKFIWNNIFRAGELGVKALSATKGGIK